MVRRYAAERLAAWGDAATLHTRLNAAMVPLLASLPEAVWPLFERVPRDLRRHVQGGPLLRRWAGACVQRDVIMLWVWGTVCVLFERVARDVRRLVQRVPLQRRCVGSGTGTLLLVGRAALLWSCNLLCMGPSLLAGMQNT